MLEQQIAEIDCEPHTLFRPHAPCVLINRELGAEADCVVAIDSKRRRTDEDLVRLGILHGHIRLSELIGTLTCKFGKKSPIPFVWRSSPLSRAISVDQAVVENVRTPVSIVFAEPGERASKPQILTKRGSARDCANHEAGDVGGLGYAVVRRLWSGNHETRKCCALDASADLRSPVLKSPCQSGVKI